MTELTKKQTDRQDLVDNAIYTMLDTIYTDSHGGDRASFSWDIETISNIRENLYPIMADEFYYKTGEKKVLSEMEFYPFLEDDTESMDKNI